MNKKILFIVIVFTLTLLSCETVLAQQPSFLVTWKSLNYAPLSFQPKGKTLPINQSLIKVSFEIIDNGTIANLSDTDVIWIVDGEWKRMEKNLKTFSFMASTMAKDSHEVTIRVLYYGKSETQGVSATDKMGSGISQNIEYNLKIPLSRPELIIKSPYPNDSTLLAPASLIFKAIPYFYNVINRKELSFRWSVNNRTLKDQNPANPDILELNIQKPALEPAFLNIDVVVSNPLKDFESDGKTINYKIKTEQ